MRIQDPAIVAAATLSHRYITDRFLPDKAIDLIDEAAARLRIENDSLPAELDEIRRRITQLEIEREALREERDQASKERLATLEKQLAELQEQNSQLTNRWQNERKVIEDLQSVRQELDAAKVELENVSRAGDWEKAARIRYERIPALEKQAREKEEQLKQNQQAGGLLREEVTPEEIAEVVSKWTGIPVSRLLEGEREKLMHMEDRLRTPRGRPGPRAAGGGRRGAAQPGGAGRSAPADRLVPVPRAHGRGQDGAVQGAGGVPLRH